MKTKKLEFKKLDDGSWLASYGDNRVVIGYHMKDYLILLISSVTGLGETEIMRSVDLPVNEKTELVMNSMINGARKAISAVEPEAARSNSGDKMSDSKPSKDPPSHVVFRIRPIGNGNSSIELDDDSLVIPDSLGLAFAIEYASFTGVNALNLVRGVMISYDSFHHKTAIDMIEKTRIFMKYESESEESKAYVEFSSSHGTYEKTDSKKLIISLDGNSSVIQSKAVALATGIISIDMKDNMVDAAKRRKVLALMLEIDKILS